MESEREILSKIRAILPPLTLDSHKGQAGRIGIVGGSKNYTGAPYFAAISALKIGCDLSHVFCTTDASQVIKSYSPELIVHPILDSPEFETEIKSQLPFLHALVIGPGLGREKPIFQSTTTLIESAITQGLPLVFDADALFYLNEHHYKISCYNKAILTPNEIEFRRLFKAVTGKELIGEALSKNVQELAITLGNVTIVKKGREDIISDGKTVAICDTAGSARRCGGQGDVLSGAMGVFSFWAHKYLGNKSDGDSGSHSATVLAAIAACMLTRRCSYLAFQKFNRSTLTTDMIGEVGEAFSSLFC